MARKMAESMAASISGNRALKLPLVTSMVGVTGALGICSQGGISAPLKVKYKMSNIQPNFGGVLNHYLVANAPSLPNNLFIHPDAQFSMWT